MLDINLSVSKLMFEARTVDMFWQVTDFDCWQLSVDAGGSN